MSELINIEVIEPTPVPVIEVHVDINAAQSAIDAAAQAQLILDQISELIGNSALNGITTLGTETIVGNQITYAGFAWKIDGVDYAQTAPIVRTLPLAAEGMYRTHTAYFTTTNDINIAVGAEDDEVTTEPNIPTGNLRLRAYNVFGEIITPGPGENLPFNINNLDELLQDLQISDFFPVHVAGNDYKVRWGRVLSSLGGNSLFIGYFDDQAAMQAYENPVDGSWGFFGINAMAHIGVFKDFGNVIYEDEDIDMEFPIPVLDFFAYNIQDPLSALTYLGITGVEGGSYSVVHNGNGFSILGEVLDQSGGVYGGVLRMNKAGVFVQNNEVSPSKKNQLRFEKPLIDSDFIIPNETGVAASKEYVNNLLEGLKTKQPVRLATTANITLSGLSMIDGETPAVGDRILAKDQTSIWLNGIYIAAAGAWARATDANTSSELTNAVVTVLEGTANAQGTFRQINTDLVLESSAVIWQTFGVSVPDATSSTKGKMKLFSDLLSSFTDGSVTQAAIVAGFLNITKKYLFASGNTITGVTGETVIQTILIPANTYNSIDEFDIAIPVVKSMTATTMAFNLYHGLTANATTTQVATLTLTTGNRINTMGRICRLSGGNANLNVPAGASQASPYQAQNVVANDFSFNPAINNYFTITSNPTVSSESSGCLSMSINPRKY